MEQINAIVDWSHIENLLMSNYPLGKSAGGNGAYSPLDPYEMPIDSS